MARTLNVDVKVDFSKLVDALTKIAGQLAEIDPSSHQCVRVGCESPAANAIVMDDESVLWLCRPDTSKYHNVVLGPGPVES